MAALAPGPPVIEPGGDAPHSDASAPATASEIAPAIPQLQGCVGRHVAYQIQEGDTIFGLCIKFRVREEDVFRCNQTLSPVIVPGFWIGIPVRDDKTEALVASMSASGTGLRSAEERETLRRAGLVRLVLTSLSVSESEARATVESLGFSDAEVSRYVRQEQMVARFMRHTKLHRPEALLYLEDAHYAWEAALQQWSQDVEFEREARRPASSAAQPLLASGAAGARGVVTVPSESKKRR